MDELMQGGAEVLRSLLGQLLDDVVDADTHGVSVLVEATSNGHSSILRLLLQRFNSRPAADAAAIEGGAPPNGHGALISPPVSAAFLAAASSGHAQFLDVLLALCPPCDLVAATDESGCNALMLAAHKGHPDCIRSLLTHSPDSQLAAGSEVAMDVMACDVCMEPGSTPLMFASVMGHAECVALLLEHCPAAQVAAVNADGNALMGAADHGHTRCIQLLLAHSPHEQVTTVDDDGINALMYAANSGHASCVQLLLAHNPGEQVAVVCALDDETALMSAARGVYIECVKLLLPHSPHTQRMDSALLRAARTYQQKEEAAAPAADLSPYAQCMELLIADGAVLGRDASDAVLTVVQRINQDLANRALVPYRVNEAVVSLAMSHSRKRTAGSHDDGA